MGQGLAQVTLVGSSWVEVVECTCDQQVGVGVEVLAEFIALVPEVAFDLKLYRLCAVQIIGFFAAACRGADIMGLELTAKFFVHHVIAQISDVADHACNAKPPTRNGALLQVATFVEVGVCDDGSASDFVEGDVFSGEVGGARNDDRMFDSRWKLQGPGECLHAAEAAAHHGGQL